MTMPTDIKNRRLQLLLFTGIYDQLSGQRGRYAVKNQVRAHGTAAAGTHLAAKDGNLHFMPTARDVRGRGGCFSGDFAHGARLALYVVGVLYCKSLFTPTG